MADPTTSPGPVADTYLIEIMVDGAANYMICARLDGPEPAERVGGVTPEQIEQLFARGGLRAAPLPPPKRPVLRAAIAAQSMDDIGLGGGG